MKRGFSLLGLIAGLAIFFSSESSAAPDPKDSVIIQSKTVTPHDGPPATLVRVWITNKDTISNYTFALVEKSTTAYMTLAWPRSFTGVATPLISTLQNNSTFAGNRYNSVSPDTFTLAGFYDPQNIATTALPPNLFRKAILDIKFDTVWTDTEPYGTVELDSAFIVKGISRVSTSFVDLRYNTIRVNFKKGVITIPDGILGHLNSTQHDVNGDGIFTVADVITLMNCVYGNSIDCNRNFMFTDLAKLLNDLFANDSYYGREK